jgi:hypothetical protein
MLGESLYPVRPGDQPFFKKQAAALFAFLVAYHRPTGRELGDWLANDDLIDEKIRGTEFERTLTKDSAGQRAGIIGTANIAGPALRLLPEVGSKKPFSTKEWAQHRRGWIFVTNTQETRLALRLLQSMWLDLLIARLLSMGEQPKLPNVWMILDELAALQNLPQLKIAITENRKAGLSIIVGFHGRSQLDGIYGKDADTIFSMPKTKILLRTSESDGADWASRLIGTVEVERVREPGPRMNFSLTTAATATRLKGGRSVSCCIPKFNHFAISTAICAMRTLSFPCTLRFCRGKPLQKDTFPHPFHCAGRRRLRARNQRCRPRNPRYRKRQPPTSPN